MRTGQLRRLIRRQKSMDQADVGAVVQVVHLKIEHLHLDHHSVPQLLCAVDPGEVVALAGHLDLAPPRRSELAEQEALQVVRVRDGEAVVGVVKQRHVEVVRRVTPALRVHEHGAQVAVRHRSWRAGALDGGAVEATPRRAQPTHLRAGPRPRQAARGSCARLRRSRPPCRRQCRLPRSLPWLPRCPPPNHAARHALLHGRAPGPAGRAGPARRPRGAATCEVAAVAASRHREGSRATSTPPCDGFMCVYNTRWKCYLSPPWPARRVTWSTEARAAIRTDSPETPFAAIWRFSLASSRLYCNP